MKKLLIVMTASIFFGGVNAQDAADKKVQAGLVLGSSLNFTNPETNLISRASVGGGFHVGMSLDWHFLDNIALSTGLEFDFDRFRHSFNESVYFEYRDREILSYSDYQDGKPTDGAMLLDERRYRNIYATIPLMLKFQTNYMGYLRYFGKFGMRNSFLMTSRADNFGVSGSGVVGADGSGSLLMPEANAEIEDMRIPGDLSFYRGAIGLSGGAEWNFAGGTCLVGELGYYYGFSNLHNGDALVGDKDKNKSIFSYDDGNPAERAYRFPSARQGLLMLKVSLLF
jgi:hypothetical protein